MLSAASTFKISRVAKLSAAEIAELDFSVTVSEEAVPPFENQCLVNVMSVPSYEKHYPLDDALFNEGMTNDRMIATASIVEETIGYIVVSRAWNECAQIDEIMLSRAHRGLGLGRALMDEAVLWARDNSLSILRLETQTTNVPACRFYERYGFKLGGFDRHLYDAIRPASHAETALFWYLHLA